jgi:predicted DNA-binding transcriptional regulator AlpA
LTIGKTLIWREGFDGIGMLLFVTKHKGVLQMTDIDQAELFTTKQAATLLKVSKNYLEQLRVTGGGPRYFKLSPQQVRYRRSDLESWLTSCARTSTSCAAQVAA